MMTIEGGIDAHDEVLDAFAELIKTSPIEPICNHQYKLFSQGFRHSETYKCTICGHEKINVYYE